MKKPRPRPRRLVSFERIAATMPALDHNPDRGRAVWTPERSEVVRWLMANPAFIAALIPYLAGRNVIAFDRAARRWRGTAWRPSPGSPQGPH
jgi:hypothetical protein